MSCYMSFVPTDNMPKDKDPYHEPLDTFLKQLFQFWYHAGFLALLGLDDEDAMAAQFVRLLRNLESSPLSALGSKDVATAGWAVKHIMLDSIDKAESLLDLPRPTTTAASLPARLIEFSIAMAHLLDQVKAAQDDEKRLQQQQQQQLADLARNGPPFRPFPGFALPPPPPVNALGRGMMPRAPLPASMLPLAPRPSPQVQRDNNTGNANTSFYGSLVIASNNGADDAVMLREMHDEYLRARPDHATTTFESMFEKLRLIAPEGAFDYARTFPLANCTPAICCVVGWGLGQNAIQLPDGRMNTLTYFQVIDILAMAGPSLYRPSGRNGASKTDSIATSKNNAKANAKDDGKPVFKQPIFAVLVANRRKALPPPPPPPPSHPLARVGPFNQPPPMAMRAKTGQAAKGLTLSMPWSEKQKAGADDKSTIGSTTTAARGTADTIYNPNHYNQHTYYQGTMALQRRGRGVGTLPGPTPGAGMMPLGQHPPNLLRPPLGPPPMRTGSTATPQLANSTRRSNSQRGRRDRRGRKHGHKSAASDSESVSGSDNESDSGSGSDSNSDIQTDNDSGSDSDSDAGTVHTNSDSGSEIDSNEDNSGSEDGDKKARRKAKAQAKTGKVKAGKKAEKTKKTKAGKKFRKSKKDADWEDLGSDSESECSDADSALDLVLSDCESEEDGASVASNSDSESASSSSESESDSSSDSGSDTESTANSRTAFERWMRGENIDRPRGHAGASVGSSIAGSSHRGGAKVSKTHESTKTYTRHHHHHYDCSAARRPKVAGKSKSKSKKTKAQANKAEAEKRHKKSSKAGKAKRRSSFVMVEN